jgi:hypothetical protein
MTISSRNNAQFRKIRTYRGIAIPGAAAGHHVSSNNAASCALGASGTIDQFAKPTLAVSGGFFVWLLCLTASPLAAAQSAAMPPFSKVEGVVQRYFEGIEEYQAGDLISRSQVQPLFDHLRILGWSVRDQKSILRDVLDDGDFLVQQLRTKTGRNLILKSKEYPLVLDRLDRVVRMQGGKQLLMDMRKLPFGYRFLEVKRGFDDLAQLLPKGPSGKSPECEDIDKPTGKIYTVDGLLARLKESYEKDVELVTGKESQQ